LQERVDPKFVRSDKAALGREFSYPTYNSKKEVPIDIKVLLVMVVRASTLLKVPKPVPKSLTKKQLSLGQ